MSKKLSELSNNKHGNYILPFLWLHGEDENSLRTEVRKIYESGIGAFCVESRPHPDFVGDKWWEDMDVILDEAKKHKMKIWILDDSHFPTGPAAGKAKTCSPEDRKMVLGYRWIDVCGPLLGSSFIPPADVDIDNIKYIVARCLDSDKATIDITEKFQSGRLYFDVPNGLWRIYYYYINPDCIHHHHINHLRPGGAKVLLDAVYEAHYRHYADDFGKTISGFFSDEPGFYACESGFDSYERKLGSEHISLNWDKDMESWLTDRIGRPIYEILPALSDNDAYTDNIRAYYRYAYMDIITSRYDRCFCTVIGDWCRNHGVEYMGHIIEDNNTHCYTSLSAGHFFRGMMGQDFSGADVVLHQILPGMDDANHAAFTGFYPNSLSEGEFYSYCLYNMATSLSQIDSKKKGRTMCELFGAYGWGEGCKLMKWMADYMLVRGVNRFVPHAFSSKEFPDDDCPPHFYAQGRNPQFAGFKKLMEYMNRTAHLLDGGSHSAQIAVIYDGDNAWADDDIMRSQEIGKVLTKAQLQYDIIPYDAVKHGRIHANKLGLNTQEYSLLIVPFAKHITVENASHLHKLQKAGVSVIFADRFPLYFLETGKPFSKAEQEKYTLVKINVLADYCKKLTTQEIVISNATNQGDLRTYIYKHTDCVVFMLTNAHPSRTVSADIAFIPDGNIYEYDAFHNALYCHKKEDLLTLPPFESKIFIITETQFPATKKPVYENQLHIENNSWTVQICSQENYPNFTFYEETNKLSNYNTPDRLPDFSGIIQYKTSIELDCNISGQLCFTGVSETIQAYINNKNMGICIAPPYSIPVTLKKGMNTIVLEVRNTLYNKVNDVFSRYLPIEATGITGEIIIKY